MLKKLALASALVGAVALAALAAPTVKVPPHLDSAGNPQESLGVACLDPTTGDAVICGSSGGTGGPPASVSLTDASIASASGASQTVAAASASRKALIVANPSATTWWLNPSGGTASANCAGCFELPAGAYWSPRPAPTNIVTGIGTVASKLTVTGG
jgi:hypothetical protein